MLLHRPYSILLARGSAELATSASEAKIRIAISAFPESIFAAPSFCQTDCGSNWYKPVKTLASPRDNICIAGAEPGGFFKVRYNKGLPIVYLSQDLSASLQE